MITIHAFDETKNRSLGQVLLRAARLFNEHSLAHVRARTGRPIRPSHVALFPHIDIDGTRATEIAARMGVTKQAVGPPLRDLVAWGFLERVADPQDGRASLIRFSHAPGTSVMEGLDVLLQVEAELARTLGAQRLDRLRDELHALDAAISALEAPTDVVDGLGP